MKKPFATQFEFYAMVALAAAVLFGGGHIVRFAWQAKSHGRELDTQWELIDSVARKLPHPSAKREGGAALTLWNVWGNMMQAEFFPGKHSRDLAEMRAITERLRELAKNTTEQNAAVQIEAVYALLLENSRNKEFVTRYRQTDRDFLGASLTP